MFAIFYVQGGVTYRSIHEFNSWHAAETMAANYRASGFRAWVEEQRCE